MPALTRILRVEGMDAIVSPNIDYAIEDSRMACADLLLPEDRPIIGFERHQRSSGCREKDVPTGSRFRKRRADLIAPAQRAGVGIERVESIVWCSHIEQTISGVQDWRSIPSYGIVPVHCSVVGVEGHERATVQASIQHR